MKKILSFLLICCSLSFFCSCEDIVGGPCEYVDIEGVATITSISDPDAGGTVEVLFDFTPNDPEASNDYLFPDWSDTGRNLTVGSGQNPTAEWVEEHEIIVESTLTCIRKEIITGTCTPVIFSFPDLEPTEAE